MAHAGTTTGLAGQASRSTWKSFLSLIVILAIGIGMLIAVPLLAGAKSTTAPAVDTSYNAVENARDAAPLSGVSADTLAKAAAAKARAMSGVAADNSYNAVEKARGGALSGPTIDPSTFDRTPRGAHGQLP